MTPERVCAAIEVPGVGAPGAFFCTVGSSDSPTISSCDYPIILSSLLGFPCTSIFRRPWSFLNGYQAHNDLFRQIAAVLCHKDHLFILRHTWVSDPLGHDVLPYSAIREPSSINLVHEPRRIPVRSPRVDGRSFEVRRRGYARSRETFLIQLVSDHRIRLRGTPRDAAVPGRPRLVPVERILEGAGVPRPEPTLQLRILPGRNTPI